MKCPSCNTALAIAPDAAFSEITCSTCGKALWFVRRFRRVDVFDFAESAGLRSELVGRLARLLGVSENVISDAARTGRILPEINDQDSLDLVDAVLDLDPIDDPNSS